MQDYDEALARLGNEPPLIADGRSGPPDRREVSARWLSGTFLTGVTSSVLMGVALFAALDGRQQLATPPEVADIVGLARSTEDGETAKAGRVIPPRQIARAKDKRRFELSTVSRVGDRDVIRTMPFLQINMALAATYKTTRSYPSFDPLAVFADDDSGMPAPATTGLIYDAKVESEMSLKVSDFPLDSATFDEASRLSAAEVEQVVRGTAAILADGAVQVAALHYVDPQRFGDTLATAAFGGAFGVRIVQENVSVAPRPADDGADPVYAEEIIPLPAERDIAAALADAGYVGDDATGIAEALASQLHGSVLKAGSVLSLGLEVRGDAARIVRANIYDRTTHVLTVALSDRGQYVIGQEPDFNPAIATAFDDSPPVIARGNLPTVYDAIYRASYSYGMSRRMTQQLIRLLAADTDFQARTTATDRIQVFFSQPDEDDQMSDESELLYVSATFGSTTRNLYRFRMEDGTIDYFDADGKSARQFLLRNPVPNGRFRSGFGGRRHPILGYTRMHTGVDWAAPSGTPIIASGNGTVEKAGWSSGYGRQTILRHANGYETSYNHQSAIAKGVVPGAKVRQGQVIGYVGSTGLSTGPHLHYELIVNGRKVDPMRVRLPGGKALSGADLEAFQRERERIDNLLKQEDDVLNVASARIVGG